MSKKKLLILKLSTGFLILLLVCTIISQNIYSLLLPRVETCQSEMKGIGNRITAVGEYGYLDTQALEAKGDWRVMEVLADANQEVKKGDPLFLIDTSQATLQTARLELSVLQLQHRLKPESVTRESDKAALQKQLDIANLELSLYEWQGEYVDKEKKAQLEQAILDAKAQVKLSSDLYDYQSLILNLRAAQNALADYRRGSDPDPIEIDKLQLAVDQAEYQVDLYQAKLLENDSLKSKVEQAEAALESFNRFSDLDTAIQKQKMELEIHKIMNQQPQTPLTSQQKTELNKQLEIARQELEANKASYPLDGKVLAPASGTLSDFSIKNGTKLSVGDSIGILRTGESSPCVKFSLNSIDGSMIAPEDSFTVEVSIHDSIRPKSIDGRVKKQEWNEEAEKWDFTIEYEQPEKLMTSVRPKVVVSHPGKVYDYVVPLSCIVPLEGDRYGVYAVEKRKGLFAEELVIKEYPIEILEKNNLYAALAGEQLPYGQDLVKYTTKPLSHNMTVALNK